MSNQMPNAPMLAGGPTSFFQTWVDALTKPNEQTYAAMATSPEASANKAFLWVFLASLVSFFISAVIQTVMLSLNQHSNRIGPGLVGLLCGVPVAAGLSVLGFIIVTGVIQWLAGLFKGAGNFNQLAYVFGAISAPITLISAVLSIFYAIPFLGLCLWPVGILIGLYALVLDIMAVKGVNRFGWGEAVGSVLVPALVICLLAACVAFVALMALGPAVGNVFSTIQQSLP